MTNTKLVVISIILVVAFLSGCGGIGAFIACGDSGYCFEGKKYGCNYDKRCLAVKKQNCLKENRDWNEEYGFCEYGGR